MRHVLIAAALCGVMLLAACSPKTENNAAAAPPAPVRKFAAVDAARLLAANEPANAGSGCPTAATMPSSASAR